MFVWGILFVVYPVVIFGEKDKSLTICGRNETNAVVCCADYFFDKSTGDCTRCPKGSTSKEGENCTQCQGHYGPSCSVPCDCKQNERCDKVEGCVAMDAPVSTEVNAGQEKKDLVGDGNSEQTKWMMFLSISVAVLSFLAVLIIATTKGIRIYNQKKTSSIKAIYKKNKNESYQRKSNIYDSYNKKETLQTRETDDEYEFDTDNCSDEEDQYASIRESQLVTTILPHDNQYSTSNLYNTGSYTYNHITREGADCSPGVLKTRENYTHNFGTTFATFQDQ